MNRRIKLIPMTLPILIFVTYRPRCIFCCLNHAFRGTDKIYFSRQYLAIRINTEWKVTQNFIFHLELGKNSSFNALLDGGLGPFSDSVVSASSA